jgi:Ca2+-binding EF-hand superfamily protein
MDELGDDFSGFKSVLKEQRLSIEHEREADDDFVKLALGQGMSRDDCLLVKRIFHRFDEDDSGFLSVSEFEQAVFELVKSQPGISESNDRQERARSLAAMGSCHYDVNASSGIDLRAFLKWYSSNRFNPHLLLTDRERWFRKLSKELDMDPEHIAKVKKVFDNIDADDNGIDAEEFKCLLNTLLKIPPHLSLPQTRLDVFWDQADTEKLGKLSFEAFLRWFTKIFTNEFTCSGTRAPFEDFYKQVRRVGPKHLDPPACPACPVRRAIIAKDD